MRKSRSTRSSASAPIASFSSLAVTAIHSNGKTFDPRNGIATTFTEPSAWHEVAMCRHGRTDERGVDAGDTNHQDLVTHSRRLVRPFSMTLVSTTTARTTGDEHARHVIETMRVLIVAGIPTGAVVVGIGSRVAMFILRITSPDAVRGVQSDDDFTIGKFTLGGTYNLLMLGAAVGIIGAGAYMLVAPWLIGPMWFRRLTTGLAAAVVAGSMLVHADGIDFTVLKPTWLAIGLFVALPGIFGTAIGVSVDAVRRSDSWTAHGRRRWVLALICVACFPTTLFPLTIALIVVLFWTMMTASGLVGLVRRIPGYGVLIRSLWLLVAVAGLVALINDINALT